MNVSISSFQLQASIKDKQLQLKRLIDQSSTGSTPTTPLHSPHTITHVTSLTPWSETTPTILEPKQPTFSYDRFLNNIVSLHKESVIGLQCDVLVMPLSSCHQPSSGTENGVFARLTATCMLILLCPNSIKTASDFGMSLDLSAD